MKKVKPNFQEIRVKGFQAKRNALEAFSLKELQAFLKCFNISFNNKQSKEQLLTRALNT